MPPRLELHESSSMPLARWLTSEPQSSRRLLRQKVDICSGLLAAAPSLHRMTRSVQSLRLVGHGRPSKGPVMHVGFCTSSPRGRQMPATEVIMFLAGAAMASISTYPAACSGCPKEWRCQNNNINADLIRGTTGFSPNKFYQYNNNGSGKEARCLPIYQ